jgi:hypothetical protein
MSTIRTKETDEAHQPHVVVDFSNQIITSLLLSLCLLSDHVQLEISRLDSISAVSPWRVVFPSVEGLQIVSSSDGYLACWPCVSVSCSGVNTESECP